MTPEQYAALQAVITAQAAAYSLQASALFAQASISLSEWVKLMQIMFPAVSEFRERSAALAREFYDSQRFQFHPELPRHDVLKEHYEFDWFLKNMEPVRKRFSQPNAPEAVTAEFTFRFVREVETAGRRQIIHAVESDDGVAEKVEAAPKPERTRVLGYDGKPVQYEPEMVQGWARVATGLETCAWCLMLVSRGPVYRSAETAGSAYDSETTLRLFQDNEEVDDMLNEWHIGCDCKVVPVFDKQEWPGKDAQERALQLWIDAADDAKEWRERFPDRVHLTGKDKGEPITFFEDQILALRRKIDSGGINSQEWAALSEAA